MRLSRGLIEQRRGNRQFLGAGDVWVKAGMVGEMLRDEPGAEFAADELWMIQQAGEQTLIALHPQQHGVLHRSQ